MYDVLKQFDIEHVISGHASGADQMAEMWADENRIPLSIDPADWSRHGKSAGPIRNQQMLDEGKPDLVVAFPGGAGTADMVRRAERASIAVYVVGGLLRQTKNTSGARLGQKAKTKRK